MRKFHAYGPLDCEDHFCVARQKLIKQSVDQLIGNPHKGGHYFTIWAPRQTGKTWLIQQLLKEIPQQYGEQFTVFQFSLGSLKGMMDAPINDDLTLPKFFDAAIWPGRYALFFPYSDPQLFIHARDYRATSGGIRC